MNVTQQLKDVLQHHNGYRVRSYSGRFMYGMDDLGKGAICYWPQAAAPDDDGKEDQE